MHLYTRLNDKWRYAAEKYSSEADLHGSGMLQHDHDIGIVLDWLKANGLEEDTIVWYSTDNGPEHSSWPHGATTPFRGEKMTTWEGGVRVISMLKWPGKIAPNQTKNGIQCHQDMFTTLSVAAGVKDVNEKVLAEKKQFIDGVDNIDYWTGKAEDSARNHIIHYNESTLSAMRMGPWKFHFATTEDYYGTNEARSKPYIFNLRMDPLESYDSSDAYGHLMQKVSWLVGPMGEILKEHLKTLAAYPPVQGGKSFNVAEIIEKVLSKGHD